MQAWCEPEFRPDRREALPLPLSVVAAFEDRVHEDLASHVTQDTFALTCFLMMVWGALRFSDVQRVECGSLQLQDGILRGRCFRTKSARGGMPFGLLCLGIYADWQEAVAKLLDTLTGCNFLLSGPSGRKANFAFALGHFRRLLMQVGGMSALQASNYTLHSLKTTGLTWALQLDISLSQRRLWGHHRSLDSGAMMACKYSRDDVLPALRAQLTVLQNIRAGWVPLTPQSRGASPPVQETSLGLLRSLPKVPPGLQIPGLATGIQGGRSDGESSSTDQDSSGSESSSDGSCSDIEERPASTARVAAGMYMVNTLTSYYHVAVCLGVDEYGRACAPRQVLRSPQWEVWCDDPAESDEVLLPCAHAACAVLF